MNEPSNELYNNVIFSRHFGNVRNMTPTNMPCDFDGFQKLIDLLFPDDIYNPKLSEIISSVKNSMNDDELRLNAFLCGSFPPVSLGNVAPKTIQFL